jgi:hypothetical protein
METRKGDLRVSFLRLASCSELSGCMIDWLGFDQFPAKVQAAE